VSDGTEHSSSISNKSFETKELSNYQKIALKEISSATPCCEIITNQQEEGLLKQQQQSGNENFSDYNDKVIVGSGDVVLDDCVVNIDEIDVGMKNNEDVVVLMKTKTNVVEDKVNGDNNSKPFDCDAKEIFEVDNEDELFVKKKGNERNEDNDDEIMTDRDNVLLDEIEYSEEKSGTEKESLLKRKKSKKKKKKKNKKKNSFGENGIEKMVPQKKEKENNVEENNDNNVERKNEINNIENNNMKVVNDVVVDNKNDLNNNNTNSTNSEGVDLNISPINVG
jgi:hypothetical protein